jgi:hypothetical protein
MPCLGAPLGRKNQMGISMILAVFLASTFGIHLLHFNVGIPWSFARAAEILC